MSESPPNPAPAAVLRTVLVIDDDDRLRPVLAATLEAHGYRTLTAPGAVQGIELARTHLPDLILCDIDMPGMDGRTLLRTLRKDPELADRQFVLMTGNTAYADPRSAMDIGADDFLIKPFSIVDLEACVAARLKRAEISRHLENKVVEQIRYNLHSTLPHEFFTPLAGVFGLTELLQEELDDLSKDEIRPILKDIHTAAKRLHRTLRNYLFIVELDHRREKDPAPFEAAFVEQAFSAGVNAAADRHQRHGDLKLELRGAALRAGPAELTALAEELADNAFSFSRKESPVSFTVRPDGNWLTLIVADQGRGMTPKQLQQLGLFQQHDRKKFEQQGLGLGLVLARKIVQRLGGEFSLESEAGRGTTVQLRLPVVT